MLAVYAQTDEEREWKADGLRQHFVPTDCAKHVEVVEDREICVTAEACIENETCTTDGSEPLLVWWD